MSDMDAVDKRLSALEVESAATRAEQAEMKSEQIAMREELTKNTCATQAVKADTEELIALFKGSKVVAHALKWGVGIAAACATIWATLKGGR